VLRTRLIHPEILAALATAGHGSQLLLSDGNFPHATASPPGARRG
jgi:L-fucose mutarotase